MALFDDATLNVGNGHLYLAPVGTVFPADPASPAVAWVEVGHTSADEVLTVSSEGGDTTVLSTLQAKTLRTSTAAKTTSYGVTLMQFDVASLKLYYGENSAIMGVGHLAEGLLGIEDAPTATQKAFLFLVFDGAVPFGWYAPKAEIIGADDISLNDSTALSGLPIKVTPLNYLGATQKSYVLPIATV